VSSLEAEVHRSIPLTALLLLSSPAVAQPEPWSHPDTLRVADEAPDLAERLDDVDADGPEPELPEDIELPEGLVDVDPESPEAEPIALPDGVERSAVTPQAVSLPSGEGSIEGMGESFTPSLSAGTGTYAVPFVLPPGRAGVAPSVALTYGTSGGNGPAGIGWNVPVPFIARQTDRGLPRYVDDDLWRPEEDRFIYNGGAELVPVAADPDGAPVPPELAGWQQYRARVEGGFMRFFRSPDARRWVVQAPSGTRFDFGELPVGEAAYGVVNDSRLAAQTEDPDGEGPVFRWWLTRSSDAHGSTVYYRYRAHEGQRYLEDIHYLSPASCAGASPNDARRCGAPLSDYGRRVGFVYEPREDAFDSYVSTWRITTAERLRRVEITAATGAPGDRFLVRRYHLRYEPSSFHSLLAEVQLEGRPQALDADSGVPLGVADHPEALLDDTLVGETLPSIRFTYSQVDATTSIVPGFGGLSGRVSESVFSPPHSVDEAHADLFDVNADGLPDLLVTDPARYRTADDEPAAGVFFNGFDGSGATPGRAGSFSEPVPIAVPATLAHVATLANQNVAPMDVDGDGRADLLHMPRVAEYGYFAVTRNDDEQAVSPTGQGWGLTHVPVVLPSGETDPRVDLGRDAAHIVMVDVDNDHLIDVVRSTGTGMQTWRNLGWLPGGEGRFGSAHHDGTGWVISTAPITSCLLHAGRPIDFADPGTQLADMNGDGIQDIVSIRRGRVVYWAGRGPGLWGEGEACADGTSGAGRHVEMASPPREVNPELRNVRLSDVNADGAADVVQVRFDEVDVWFNRAGAGFTERLTLRGTPAAADYLNRVRFADIDGSGTPDIVYANAHRWQYVDLHGGVRPRMLVRVDNGLGATTRLEYASSAEDYLRDLARAEDSSCSQPSCETFRWNHVRGACDAMLLERAGVCAHRSGGSPALTTVVRAIETTDNFDALGREANVVRTEYRYHDAYYEGIEQEHRGFGAADTIGIGDLDHPTSIGRTHFHQGRRPNAIASDRLADNPNEALKGETWLGESWDPATGAVLETSHTSFTLRELALGLDGRHVVLAYGSQSDALAYDQAPFVPNVEEVVVPRVTREQRGGVGAVLESETRLAVRGAGWAHVRSRVDEVDDVGNVRRSTGVGRIRGEYGEPQDPAETIVQRATFVRLADASGWLWASPSSWVEGIDGVPLGRVNQTFDPETGDVLRAEAEASTATSGTFEFAGAGGAAGYVHGDQTLTSSSRFDAWGQAITSCAGGDLQLGDAGCLRYAEVDRDTDWAAFATVERVAVSRTGGAFGFLTITAEHDRALGVALRATDANGYATEIGYDGLGRVRYQRAPNVDGCTGDVPLRRVDYEITTDPAARPISVMRSHQELSCVALGDDTLESVSYVDGLGRVRATLTEGEDASRPWIRGGVTRFTSRGSVARAWQSDRLLVASPTPEDALALPSVPSTSALHDAFGRPLISYAEDGAETITRYHALSVDICDPLDLGLEAPFSGTCGTTRSDGHGRVIDQVLRNRQPGLPELEHHRLFTEYRADGAVTRVVRAQTMTDVPLPAIDPLPGRSVERRFFLDTAGRRVSATDPDSDSRDPGKNGSNRSWRYLYNRVGDLAAVRDPRGCGQNYYYDHGGRLVGERYVPCAEAHDLPAPVRRSTTRSRWTPARARTSTCGCTSTATPGGSRATSSLPEARGTSVESRRRSTAASGASAPTMNGVYRRGTRDRWRCPETRLRWLPR